MSETKTAPAAKAPRLTPEQLVEAFRALSRSKQGYVLEAVGAGLEADTPDGLHVTARSRKELRRFVREKDTAVVDWMRRFEAGEAFYDIGANCGGLTLTAGAMHRDRITIVAIEPSFGSFESLARNLSGNRMLSFVVPLQVALLDRTGLATMYYRSTAAGTSLHAVGAPVGHTGERFEAVETQLLPTFTLDDLIAVLKLPPPTRVKIDVDGYEAQVLRGATRLLAARTIRDMVVEVVNHDGQHSRLAEVRAFLAEYGYHLTSTLDHSELPESIVADYWFTRGAEAPGAGGREHPVSVDRSGSPDGGARALSKDERREAKQRQAEAHERDSLTAKPSADDAPARSKEHRLQAKQRQAEARERERLEAKAVAEEARRIRKEAAKRAQEEERRRVDRRTGKERRAAERAAEEAARKEQSRQEKRIAVEIRKAARRAARLEEKERLRAQREEHRQQAMDERQKREAIRNEYRDLKAAYEDLARQLAELRGSYYLSGSRKKIDIPSIEGLADVAARVKADGRLGMDYDRLYTLWQAAEQTPPSLPVIEVGAYRGGSARFLVEAFRYQGRAPRFYVCDTFSGHARVDAQLDPHHHDKDKFVDTSPESVADYLKDFPNVQLVVGDIIETAPRFDEESAFGLVHVDVDVYAATDFCLRYFVPKLAPGALLVVDDYGFVTCPGAKKAVDDFMAGRDDLRMLHLLSGQAVIFRVA